ncbi:hypothetical protein VTI28DRAFT_4476 [Corynascus sepedonium]
MAVDSHAVVDNAVEVDYREADESDRTLKKALVYTVGDSKLSQKWKSAWLSMKPTAKIVIDPSRKPAKPRTSTTRYAFILTQEELVAMRIRRIKRPAGGGPEKHYTAIEYAPVPWAAKSGLTTSLAI